MSAPDFDWLTLAASPHIVRNRLGQTYSFLQAGDDQSDNSMLCKAFDWHSDGLYLNPPPKYVLMYCLHPGDHGVSTGMCNVDKALDSLPKSARAMLAMLDVTYYGHNGDYRHPMLTGDGLLLSSRGQIEPRKRTMINFVSVRQAAYAVDSLFDALDAHKFQVGWEPGKLLVFDQRRYMHCRDSNVLHDPCRKLVRMWLNEWPA